MADRDSAKRCPTMPSPTSRAVTRLMTSEMSTAAGQADGQRDETRAQILRQQHAEELAPLHAQHEVHAEFVPPPREMKAVGVVYEKEQNEQRQPVQHRDERQQPVHGIALHALQKHHHVLMRQGENDVKRDDRDEQGGEKQPVFPAGCGGCCA